MYKKLNAAVKQIEGLKEQMQTLSDEELKELTEKFRTRLQKGETLDQILPEAYAAVREAAVRTLGMEHFPVQLLGGIILHQGKIVEMKTGEGKTLVSTLPAYLNALEGKGVHIVTVNDYLAKRDAEMMGKVYAALGMTTGVVLSHMDNCSRKEAYACDITYVTNSEVGFDYLRDNMVYDTGERVLRGLHYAIIDEIDSILIDEARTPLIISGQGKNATKLYEACDILAREMVRGSGNGEFTKADILDGKTMEEDGDYVVNEKDKYICLTENGARKAETYFHIENLADPANLDKQHTLIMALRAHSLMQLDKDYVVKNGEVLIVDAFTGRILPGRRFSDGLHQALEAKEHVVIQPENRTHATITFQNFFNKYEKKCGMTGTAVTEKREFKTTYHLKTCELPTNKPVIRKDLDDVMYQTKAEKYRAIVEEVKSAHASGQPVLVGTATIDVSEELSRMLLKEGISHQVLNAKQDEKEAQIVAEAGRFGAVTIATNMAGRGIDIQLDEAAKEAGGLYVIGTERHESRRIDNQLRGRSGRQGDPGKSCFFLSLEDDLMRIFGSERMKQVLTSAGIEEGEPIGHRILSKSISKAQKKVEGNHYSTRKSLLDYDEVKSAQREMIYRERDRILEMKDSKAVILSMAESIIDQALQEVGRKGLEETLVPIIPFPSWQLKEHFNFIHLRKSLYTNMRILYDEIEEQFQDPQILRQTEQSLILHIIDEHWMGHLDDLETLREGIGMYSYAQSDPRIIYKEKAYELFDAMLDEIRKETVRFLFHIQVDGNYIIGV